MPSKRSNNEISFEQAVHELEEVVTKLENEDVSLKEAIKFFEEGTKLASVCYKKINSAKLKLTKLERNSADE